MQLKTGQIGEIQTFIPDGCLATVQYRDIVHPDGVTRVEYYRDEDPDHPTAYPLFRVRSSTFTTQAWATIVIDSVTFLELLARKYDEKVMNPVPAGMTKYQKGTGIDARQWFGASTDALEEILCVKCIALPMNVVVVSHIAKDRNELSGEILQGPFAPGRLSARKLLNAGFQEQYYASTSRDGEGQVQHMLKTRNDGQWAAASQMLAPDPCWPHYDSLWENWDGPRIPINVLIYGDTGVGKSQFAATFPKPMLVCVFDGKNKDIPYWKHWA